MLGLVLQGLLTAIGDTVLTPLTSRLRDIRWWVQARVTRMLLFSVVALGALALAPPALDRVEVLRVSDVASALDYAGAFTGSLLPTPLAIFAVNAVTRRTRSTPPVAPRQRAQ